MKSKAFLVLVVLTCLFIFSTNSQAVMTRVIFNAWTQDEPGPGKRLCVLVEIWDDDYIHPPEAVKEVRIGAPDGSVLNLDLSKDWLPWDGCYYRAFYPTEFVGQVIPKGTYWVRVYPNVGASIYQTDAVANTFLPIPNLTYPTPDLTDVPETPVITWDAVPGTAGTIVYEIRLFNSNWQDWVYYYPLRPKYTAFTKYAIPKGMLKPNCDYRIQILARSGPQDLDMRSRTGWIHFKTGSW